MCRWTLLGLLSIGFLCPPHAALAQGAHSHGVAALNVAIGDRGFRLEFDSPLENLVGFERAPRNAKEEQAVRDVVARLRAADQLFVAEAAAQCKLAKSELASPVLPRALLEGGAAPAQAAPGKQAAAKGEHADLEAKLEFACANPGSLTRIDAKPLFAAFARLRRVDVQVAAPKGQAKRQLTPARPEIAW
jgi:hypothetical protein